LTPTFASAPPFLIAVDLRIVVVVVFVFLFNFAIARPLCIQIGGIQRLVLKELVSTS
jgi:hypothetical protein